MKPRNPATKTRAMLDGERQQVVIPGAKSREALLEAALKSHQRVLRGGGDMASCCSLS